MPSTLSSKDKLPFAYWLVHRDDVPFVLLKWDTENECCPPSTPQDEHLYRLDYYQFDLLAAFGAYPVMTMDEYSESILERRETGVNVRTGTILRYNESRYKLGSTR